MKIAFQGEHGAYSEQAIIQKFGNVETIPCKRFKEIFEKVKNEEVDLGMVPVQNSTAGSIARSYDLLVEYDLPIVGEHYFQVKHCLIGAGNPDTIREVYSHPQALAQCQEYIEQMGWDHYACEDTAGAVRRLSESKDITKAAIAGSLAAEIYDLPVIREDIQTKDNNTTRFVVIGREDNGKQAVPYKTSVVFEVRSVPAALYKCLGGFATNNVNLTKLESRPCQKKQWNYLFYLDFEGHVADEAAQHALDELKYFTTFMKVLGSYPKGNQVHQM